MTKKICFVVLCALMCCGLSSCVYSSVNLIRVQGTDVDCSVNPLLQLYTFKGKEIAVTIFRQMGSVKKNKDGSSEKPVSMPDISEIQGSWKLDNAPQRKAGD